MLFLWEIRVVQPESCSSACALRLELDDSGSIVHETARTDGLVNDSRQNRIIKSNSHSREPQKKSPNHADKRKLKDSLK